MLPIIIAAFLGTAMATDPAKCADDCSAQWSACKAAANANQSFCGSQYATCLGFNPFTDGFKEPTACSSNGAGVSSTSAAPSASPTADACAQKCLDAWYACKTGPNPNQSFCAATLARCVGYNPFENGATALPTTCKTTTAAPTATPTADACAQKCLDGWYACKTAANANQAFCASQLTGCLGYSPFDNGFVQPTACKAGSSQSGVVVTETTMATVTSCPPSTAVGTTFVPSSTLPPPVVTAAAGHLEPAMLLVALGAAALF
jgi:hypothetical protein